MLNGRLEQIADEMDATLYRSAFNPIIAEAHDACHGLYGASGATLVQGKSGLPVFVGAMSFAVRPPPAAQARGGMRDGDVWILNDPYDGGTRQRLQAGAPGVPGRRAVLLPGLGRALA